MAPRDIHRAVHAVPEIRRAIRVVNRDRFILSAAPSILLYSCCI